jgi:hypothetical protein
VAGAVNAVQAVLPAMCMYVGTWVGVTMCACIHKSWFLLIPLLFCLALVEMPAGGDDAGQEGVFDSSISGPVAVHLGAINLTRETWGRKSCGK